MSTRASATVDVIEECPWCPEQSVWEVRVWSPDLPNAERTYIVNGRSEDYAAREGIRRFCEEMDSLPESKPQGH